MDITDPMFVELNEIAFSVEDNRLVFESEEEFQKCIDFLAQLGDENFPAFEKVIGFESYRLYYESNQGRSEKLVDDLIATLINPKAAIIIGKYQFKVDFENEKIEMLILNNDCEDRLKSANMSNQVNSVLFDWTDDIFARLNNEVTLKSSYCTSDQDEKYPYNLMGSDTVKNANGDYDNSFWYETQAKLCYQNLGFIHTMITKYKITKVLWQDGTCPTFRFKMDVKGYYDRKRRNPRDVNENIQGNVYGHDDEISWRLFNGTRRVQGFNITTDFSLEVMYNGLNPWLDGDTHDLTSLNISCN